MDKLNKKKKLGFRAFEFQNFRKRIVNLYQRVLELSPSLSLSLSVFCHDRGLNEVSEWIWSMSVFLKRDISDYLP